MVKRKKVTDYLPSARKCVFIAFVLLVSAITFFISKNQTSYAEGTITANLHFEISENLHLLIHDGNFTWQRTGNYSCTIETGQNECFINKPKVFLDNNNHYLYGNRVAWETESDISVITELIPDTSTFIQMESLPITREMIEQNGSSTINFSLTHYFEHTATYTPGYYVERLKSTSDSDWVYSVEKTCQTTHYTRTFTSEQNHTSWTGCKPAIPYGVQYDSATNDWNWGTSKQHFYTISDSVVGQGKIELDIYEDQTIRVNRRFPRTLRFNTNGSTLTYNSGTYISDSVDFTCYAEAADGDCTLRSFTVPKITAPSGFTAKGYSFQSRQFSTEADDHLATLINNNIGEEVNSGYLIEYSEWGDKIDVYAFSEKAITISFLPNSNQVSPTQKVCYITPNSSCSVSTPSIPTQENTPTVVGWSPTQNGATLALHNPNYLRDDSIAEEYRVYHIGSDYHTLSEDPTVHLYAQTVAKAKTYQALFNNDMAPPVTKKCTIPATYNNVVQESSCAITSPDEYNIGGYRNTKWTDGTNTIQPNQDVALTNDVTYNWAGDPNINMLKFDANGGSGTMTPVMIYHNKQLTLPNNTFTNEGKAFVGWNTKADGSGTSYTDGQTTSFRLVNDNGTLYLYAQWETLYTINYNCTLNGGTCDINTPGYKPAGAQADLDRTATKSGWQFLGWNTVSNATSALSSYTVTGDETLYAIFKKNVQVIFENNGASFLHGETIFGCVMYNRDTSCQVRYTAPTITPKEHYTAVGFSTDKKSLTATLGAGSGNTETLSQSKTYYATHYATSDVIFVDNGNTINGDKEFSCYIIGTETNCTTVVPDFTPAARSKRGYTNTANFDEATERYNPGDILRLYPRDFGDHYYLYAQSISAGFLNSATFTDNLKGTSEKRQCHVEPVYNASGQATSCTITTPDLPSHIGYRARVWKNTETNTEHFNNTEISLTQSSTTFVDSNYQVQYKISFNPNGGNGSTITTGLLNYYEPYTIPKNTFTHNGNYRFVKWCTSADGTGTCYDEEDVVKELSPRGTTVQLYAIWQKYARVYFDASENGGSTLVPPILRAVPFTISITPLDYTASKNGYQFIGWNDDKDATTIRTEYTVTDSDITVYAIFKKTMTVTFDKNGASSLTGTTTYSCDAFNNNTSCQIRYTAPTITPRDNFTALGFSTNQNATSSTLEQGISAVGNISSNRTYYAITKSTATATFNDNAGNTIIGQKSRSCDIYNAGTSCSITSPDFNTSNQYKIGYTTSSTYSSSDDVYDVNHAINLAPGQQLNLYPHSTNDAILRRATFNYEESNSIFKTCTIPKSYNNTPQADYCEITAPALSAITGYKSHVWDSNGTSIAGGSTIRLYKDMSYDEKKTPIEYTIKFDHGDGKGSMPNVTYKYDQEYTLPSNAFTHDGEEYYFEKWCLSGESYAVCFNENDKVTNLTNTDGKILTLEAIWAKHDYITIKLPPSKTDPDGKEVKCIYYTPGKCSAKMPDPSEYPQDDNDVSGYKPNGNDGDNSGLSDRDFAYDPNTRSLVIVRPYNELKDKNLAFRPTFSPSPESVRSNEKLPRTGDVNPGIFITVSALLTACAAFGVRYLIKRR
ncbi:InlB B-repeat-containing protein [Candidatus Saccharibacteria bacterium]|nr:InlB B-repeat-containing protein [Candidatus Saccharibacteria bacterium]